MAGHAKKDPPRSSHSFTIMRGLPFEVKTISLIALERSKRTIEDIVKTYFPLLGLGHDAFFNHMDIIMWIEATIYQLDEENEHWCKLQLAMSGAGSISPPCSPMPSLLLSSDGSMIRQILSQRGLMDERIEGELRAGDSYWQLERDIARSLASGEKGSPLDESIIIQAHCNKSFDYRLIFLVLHHLYSLLPYDEILTSFLHVDERLVDIADDLADYEDDVECNSFNLLRCFVALHGAKAGVKLAELISALEVEHSRLYALLSLRQKEHWRERHEDSRGVNDGGMKWQVPPLILNEKEWRTRNKS